MDLMACLAGIARQGKTLVVALHQLNVAAAFADNLVMMEDGHRSSLSGFASLMTQIKGVEGCLTTICAKGSRPMEMNHAALPVRPRCGSR